MLDINKIYQELKETVSEDKIILNANMKEYTSFKIGGKADILVTAKKLEEVKNILKISKENNCPLFILGNGTNILVKDNGIRGIVLRNRLESIEFIEDNPINEYTEVIVGSGVKNGVLAQKLLAKDLSGFEFASRNTWDYRWSS